jgi:hypothetical protein
LALSSASPEPAAAQEETLHQQALVEELPQEQSRRSSTALKIYLERLVEVLAPVEPLRQPRKVSPHSPIPRQASEDLGLVRLALGLESRPRLAERGDQPEFVVLAAAESRLDLVTLATQTQVQVQRVGGVADQEPVEPSVLKPDLVLTHKTEPLVLVVRAQHRLPLAEAQAERVSTVHQTLRLLR